MFFVFFAGIIFMDVLLKRFIEGFLAIFISRLGKGPFDSNISLSTRISNTKAKLSTLS